MRTILLLLTMAVPASAEGWVFTDAPLERVPVDAGFNEPWAVVKRAPAKPKGCNCGDACPCAKRIALLEAENAALKDELDDLREHATPEADDPDEYIAIVGASWCGPCKSAVALCKQSETRYVYVDFEKDPAGAAALGFKKGDAIPLFVIVRDGKPAHRATGFTSSTAGWCAGVFPPPVDLDPESKPERAEPDPKPKSSGSYKRMSGSNWGYKGPSLKGHLTGTHGLPSWAVQGRSSSELRAMHSDRHNGYSVAQVLSRLSKAPTTVVASKPSGRWVTRRVKKCGVFGCRYVNQRVWVSN